MNKVLIEDLVEYKWLCPFNMNTLDILNSNEVSSKYIQQFFDLCLNVGYQFSSPGNSFERKADSPGYSDGIYGGDDGWIFGGAS